MSRFFDLVSKPVREMGEQPPAAAARKTEFQPRLIKLDSNENPFGPSPKAIEALQSAISAAHAYPDDTCTDLRRSLAEKHSLPVEQALISAGSTALLGLLCQTMLGPGFNAVTSERSFIVYSMAVQATGAQLIETPMRDDTFDLGAILSAINEYTRLVFIANPNNPTGTMLTAEQIDNFLAEVPGHVVVVLDEAYYDFALHFAAHRNLEHSHSLNYVQQGAGVIVLRTFSKAHGLAGLRIGYGLGPAELLGYIARVQSSFAVSSVAQAAALAALEDESHIARVVSSNAAQSRILGVGLSELEFRVVPTSANFLYCDVHEDAAAIAERLRSEGVSVRPLAAWGAPTCIRVSIGTPEQNQFLLSAMRKVRESSRRSAGHGSR
ncbi:MAG TPA: histidinol-phosphate transaminase [Candidatus Solibacter sp.]|nr:histidinol-phosphate transaminase [Candidatus Solibacter sp.]